MLAIHVWDVKYSLNNVLKIICLINHARRNCTLKIDLNIKFLIVLRHPHSSDIIQYSTILFSDIVQIFSANLQDFLFFLQKVKQKRKTKQNWNDSKTSNKWDQRLFHPRTYTKEGIQIILFYSRNVQNSFVCDKS